MPSHKAKYGSIGRVPYADGFVNVQSVPWSELVPRCEENGARFSVAENEEAEGSALTDAEQVRTQGKYPSASTIKIDDWMQLVKGDTRKDIPQPAELGNQDIYTKQNQTETPQVNPRLNELSGIINEEPTGSGPSIPQGAPVVNARFSMSEPVEQNSETETDADTAAAEVAADAAGPPGGNGTSPRQIRSKKS